MSHARKGRVRDLKMNPVRVPAPIVWSPVCASVGNWRHVGVGVMGLMDPLSVPTVD